MTDDIVARLRGSPGSRGFEKPFHVTMAEAADEIERLRAALGKEETKQSTPGYEHMTPETVQAIRDTCSTPASRVGKTQSEVFKEEGTP